MGEKVDRPSIRDGYDLWSETYDATPNPLVTLDRRHTTSLLRPQPYERILDAGCGTGGHLGLMLLALSSPFGLDLSRGMLGMARRKFPSVPLAQADLNDRLPVHRRIFDAVLCALVSEHIAKLGMLFRDFFDSLAAGGRLVFSAFHPEMAAAGIEAKFDYKVRLLVPSNSLGSIRSHRMIKSVSSLGRSVVTSWASMPRPSR